MDKKFKLLLSSIKPVNMDSNLLITWGAVSKKIDKGEYIFHEGEDAKYYFQIESGCVKMFNTNDDGKEFIQGAFTDGQSFGEAPLFIDEKYPSSSMATKSSIIFKLAKDRFFQILSEYRSIEKEFLTILARRVYMKSIIAREVINNPEHRIISFLHEYKKGISELGNKVIIPYTRQEIANFTGLRVETVIRTLSALKEMKKVDIIDRKLYY